MNLYKFTFDLKGSSNLMQTVTIPTDSKYSVGIKICDGENEVVLDDSMKITIQDDKFIYTPTEIFNNYAVFACKTDSEKGTTKTYQVNFHKDGSELVEIWSKTYTFDGAPRQTYFTANIADFVDMLGDDVEKWDLHKFTRYCDWPSIPGWKDGHTIAEYCNTRGDWYSSYLTRFPQSASYFMNTGTIIDSSRKVVIFPGQYGSKYGWVVYDSSRAMQDVTEDDIITTGKFSDYGVDVSSFYMLFFVQGQTRPAGDYNERVTYGDAIPEFNQIFRGFNVKTNDSEISMWGITNSQMKIVYPDEWEILKDNADDRVIYFVVDKPTPPTPIPPKPVPGGDVFGMDIVSDVFPDVTKDTTYDPTSKADALRFDGCVCSKRYEINGKVFYLDLTVGFSDYAVIEGDYAKVDVVVPEMGWSDGGDIPGYTVNFSGYMFDGNKISLVALYKQFDSQEERNAYRAEWNKELNDGEPVIKLDLPDDIDDWQLFEYEEIPEEFIVENNDDYAWVEMEWEEEGEMLSFKEKFLKKVSTYPQWVLSGPN